MRKNFQVPATVVPGHSCRLEKIVCMPAADNAPLTKRDRSCEYSGAPSSDANSCASQYPRSSTVDLRGWLTENTGARSAKKSACEPANWPRIFSFMPRGVGRKIHVAWHQQWPPQTSCHVAQGKVGDVCKGTQPVNNPSAAPAVPAKNCRRDCQTIGPGSKSYFSMIGTIRFFDVIPASQIGRDPRARFEPASLSCPSQIRVRLFRQYRYPRIYCQLTIECYRSSCNPYRTLAITDLTGIFLELRPGV